MSDQQNNIKFVQEVEKYPCLYDYRLMDYARKDLTEKAWNHVGKIFNLTGPQSKEKWRNLRTVFARNLKPLPSGSSTKVKKPYYLADAMQFAIPFIKTQTSTVSGNFPPKDDPEITAIYHTDNEEDTKESIYLINSPPSAYCHSSILPSPSPHPSPPPSPQTCSLPALSPQSYSLTTPPRPISASESKRSRNSKDMTEIDEIFLEYLKLKKANIENSNNTDPTKTSKKMFLLSLLPDVYSMNDVQMRTFRIKVLTLIDEIFQTPNSS